MDWLLAGGSYPVQVMTKWLLALRLVCQVVLAIEAEADPTLSAAPVMVKGNSAADAIKRRLSIASKEKGGNESLGDLLKSEGEV